MSANDSSNWLDAYVMGYDTCFFFMVIEKGVTAVLHDKIVEIGSFYQVKIAINERAPPRYRARHYVTQYRKIDPLAPVRVDPSDGKHVFITTTAEFHGYVTQGTNTYAKFWNNTFGTFIDLYRIIKDTKKSVEFEFKCKSSPVNKIKSIFVPVKVIRYLDREDVPDHRRDVPNHRTVSGLVFAESKHHRFVWSKDLDRDAILEDRFCSGVQDIIGRWVEIVVDDDDRVVEPVRILNDAYQTRELNKVAEILVTMRHDGLYDSNNMKFHMFLHEDLGFIADSEHMIPMPSNRRWYRAWIQCHKIKNLTSQWRISEKQGEPLILDDSRSDGERSDCDQGSVSSHNEDCGRQHGPASRSSSPDHRNISSHNSHVGSLRSSRSPPRHPYQWEHGFGSESSDRRTDVEPRTSSLYPNQRPLRKLKNSSETPPVVSKSRDLDSTSEKTVSETASSEAFGYSDEEDVEPARRREAPKSPSGDSYCMSGMNYGAERELRTSTMSYDEPKTPSYQAHIPNESPYGTPIANIQTPIRVTAPCPAVDIPITFDWREMFHRSCELLEFFTMNPKVGREMKLLDVEQYDEAKELVEINKNN